MEILPHVVVTVATPHHVALECDRYGVSDKAAAAIVNAALQDSGQLKNNYLTLVVDRSKIRRERKRVRNELKCDSLTQINQNPVCGLYFDGRKDNTVVKIAKGEKYCRNIMKEEHITIVQEPKSKYIGHITVSNGEAISIAKGIINFLNKMNRDCNLTVIGCDGTDVNTGVNRRVIRRLEMKFGRPLQWAVCLLYANELPLRHLLQIFGWCDEWSKSSFWANWHRNKNLKNLQLSYLKQ
ncbi:hypothetical protein AVEN_47352-1 [Araneus ventricosus]|uniref:Uncharacterized protein n=1 Tax=Araneus ventricosus TaxID=182803 RepID=A0A4Y2FAC0_ARAVE|nr:hypothetical protein AVEN_47352-1 [Araneus ventricosus]